MKKFLFVVCFLLLFASLYAQNSRVEENPILYSSIMHREMHYSVYFPAGYLSSKKTYPVLYLLHGVGANHLSWIKQGNIQHILDRAIAMRALDPMVVIMPDAGMSYYMNSMNGSLRYEDYFFQELMPHIEHLYYIAPGKRNCSIAGFSMGGYGALLYAIHRPDLFETCVAMSPGIRTDEQINQMTDKEYNERYGVCFGPVSEEQPRVPRFYQTRYSILHLVSEMPEEQKKAVRLYIDIGDDDFLYKGSSLLHILLRDREIEHEFRIRNGAHNWSYWRSGIVNGLSYIQAGLR
ncbi:MAG: alpha/beta hydrolase-fold protein [Bacteroidaceae bacterium]